MTDSPEKPLLLRDARIVLPDQVIERGTLLIDGAFIARTSQPGESGFPEYDLSGLTLFPGFIDAHIHGAIGVDTMAASAADLDRVSLFLATCGVTGWLPTLVPAPAAEYARAIRSITEASESKLRCPHPGRPL